MRRHMLPGRLATMALCLTFAAAACNKSDKANETAGGAVAAEQLSVKDVELGKTLDANKKVQDETDDFAPTDVIYVSVETEGTATGTLTARWTFEDGQVVDESSQSIAPTGPATTEFHISKADGLPKGKYTVEILLNGTSKEKEDFKVE